MKVLVFTLGWMLATGLTVAALVGLVRWARRDRRGAIFVGSAMVFFLGFGLIPETFRQRIEEAREDKGKKGAESGDPPDD